MSNAELAAEIRACAEMAERDGVGEPRALYMAAKSIETDAHITCGKILRLAMLHATDALAPYIQLAIAAYGAEFGWWHINTTEAET